MAKKSNYHHGDLRSALLKSATQSLQQDGIDALSLRKISEHVGVSRMGAYHHFKNKHELLCAVAAQGFTEFQFLLNENLKHLDTQVTVNNSALKSTNIEHKYLEQALSNFIESYLNFALKNSQQYQLMFGYMLWKQTQPTKELKKVAYDCFKDYANAVRQLLETANINTKNSLRTAQINWATLHGLSHFFIDGIYVEPDDIENIKAQTLDAFMSQILSS